MFTEVPCGKCGEGVPRHALAEHTADCQADCPHCDETLENQRALTTHLRKDCPNVEAVCSAGDGTRRCGAKMLRKDLAGHRRDVCPSMRIDCRYKSAGCPHKCARRDMAAHCKASTEAHLALAMGALDREPPATTELLWTIEDAPRHIRDKTKNVVWNPRSVIGPFGYKIALVAKFNKGDDSDHLGLSVGTTPGPFDDVLQWPFAYGYTVTLLDRTAGSATAHVSHTRSRASVAEGGTSGEDKPFNQGSRRTHGWSKFISHADLATRGYVKDGKIRVRVTFSKT